jgi:predicted ArsR family transcriptional regulator
MERSREKILRLIQEAGAVNVETLAGKLGLAAATVRRHLDILQRDGMVEYVEVRRHTGRPEYSFSLTERGHESMPKAYDALLTGLLQEIGTRQSGELDGKSGRDVLKESFESLGRKAAAGYMSRASHDPVAAVVQALKDRDFAPDAVRIPGGLRLKLANCPFRSVAMVDQAVCAYDSTLIASVLGSQVRREGCVVEGVTRCTYVATDVSRPAPART